MNVPEEELDQVGVSSTVLKDKSVPLFAVVSYEDVVTNTSGPVELEVVEPLRNDFVREHNDNIENILVIKKKENL